MLKIIFFLIIFFCIFSSIALAEYNLEILELPNEIFVERGWLKYFNIVINNNGSLALSNVTIYFEGEFSNWFEVQANQIELLEASKNASFLVKLSVPSDVETKSYSFILFAKSKEIVSSKKFTVRVFKSKADMMLYQINELELKIIEIQNNAKIAEESGKNVTSILSLLSKAKSYLEISKNYINNEDYNKVTDLMINAENLIKEAEYDLTIAQPKITASSSAFPFEILLLPIFIIPLIVFIFLKSGKENVKKIPVVKIKEIVLEGKEVKSLEEELKKIENSINLLEEEYKGNLISKESYDELKEKYEKRMAEIKSEIERNKKVV